MDPLAGLAEQDMTEVDTDFPLLPSAQYDMTVASMEVVESKNKPGNHNILVELATTEDVQAHESERILKAGHKVRSYYPLQNPDPNPSGFNFQENIARFIDAVMGTNKANRPNFDRTFGDYLNKPVVATIAIREREENGEKTGMFNNDVKKLAFPG